MHKVCLSDLWGHGTKDMGETEWTDELEGPWRRQTLAAYMTAYSS